MKNIIILFSLCLLAAGFTSCKNNPVESGLEPGRRDYTWTADTISAYMDGVSQIGGTSINSLWAVGPSGNGYPVRKFDGLHWSVVTDAFIGDINAIGPISENNVWFGGLSDGLIYHYDGLWTKSVQYKETGVRAFSFADFCSNKSDDIYLCGVAFYPDNSSRGVIMHYNGYGWRKVYHSGENSDYVKMNRDIFNNCFFIYSLKWSLKAGQPDTSAYMKYDGKKMTMIYSEPHFNNGASLIRTIGGRVYFGMKDGIYIYDKERLKQYIQMPLSDYDWYAPFGRNEKDIFISDKNGIYHYNGTDVVKMLTYKTNETFLDAVVFDKDVFILSTPNFSKFIIYHGTLKN